MDNQAILGAKQEKNWITVFAWLLLISVLVIAFAHNFAEMWLRWFPAWRRGDMSLYAKITRGESYYTHAPLVPLVSFVAFVLLLRHLSIPLRPRRIAGFFLLSFSVIMHLFSSLARVNFTSGFALIGVLAGLVLFLWGDKALRRLWFPLAFLVFMIPLPELSISQLNFRLKMIAADWGVGLANTVGIISELKGNRVFLLGDKSMVIANVCNGLRTLICLIAFGAVYAYVCRLRGWWRLFLFVMSVPVAVVSNTLRIMSLIFVADKWDVETATGFYHDISGLMILVVAYLLMFSLERLVLWIRKMVGKPAEISPLFEGMQRGQGDKQQGQRLARAIRSPRGWTAIMIVALAAGGSWWLNRATPAIYDEDMLHSALPEQIKIGTEQWESFIFEFDPKALLVLETEDALLRRYVCASQEYVDFCIVFSKDNRKGTHPPDVCLEGSGQDIIAKGSLTVDDIPARGELPCREIVVQSESELIYYLYTYKCGQNYTDSFWRQQLIIFTNGLLNRNASGALIRVSTPVDAELEDAREKAAIFMRMGIPYLDRALP